jgi:hypothetical protein
LQFSREPFQPETTFFAATDAAFVKLFGRDVLRFLLYFPAPPTGGTFPEEHHFMSRSTLMALAISCVLSCASYAQNSTAKPQQAAPPANGASAQSAAPVANNATPSPPAAPAPAPPAANTLPSTSVVPMTETVLTLKGACQPKAGTADAPSGCVSSMTREQFEKLVNALTPTDRAPMPPDMMRNFATQYAKLLIFSDYARSLGMENDPRVLEIMQFARNQILTEALNQRITEDFSHPTDQQIEDYYKQNSKKYLEATLQRIIIPRNQGTAEKPKPSEADEKAYAEQIQKRWVASEDPDKLEKEATAHSGLTTPPASVNVGPRRPGTLPEAHESVFDLKPGEVSAVFSDPASFYIYKVVSVRTVPLSEAKDSIIATLKRQLVTDKIQQIQSSVTPVFNDTYFGPEKPPGPPTPRMINPRRATPPGPGAPPAPAQGATPPAASAPPQNPGNTPPPNPQAPPQ